jgi:hypothetical protein
METISRSLKAASIQCNNSRMFSVSPSVDNAHGIAQGPSFLISYLALYSLFRVGSLFLICDWLLISDGFLLVLYSSFPIGSSYLTGSWLSYDFQGVVATAHLPAVKACGWQHCF